VSELFERLCCSYSEQFHYHHVVVTSQGYFALKQFSEHVWDVKLYFSSVLAGMLEQMSFQSIRKLSTTDGGCLKVHWKRIADDTSRKCET